MDWGKKKKEQLENPELHMVNFSLIIIIIFISFSRKELDLSVGQMGD